MENLANVFFGPSAVKDFLTPHKLPPTPLVELPESLNPFLHRKVRIFAKVMYLLPLMNSKSLPSLCMLMEAGAKGDLEGVEALVENSSGNTAFCLAILARHFGIRRVTAIVPADIAPGKLELLRLAGARPTFPSAGVSGIALARQMGEENGSLNLGQYENSANPLAHERWTALQIWEQLGGRLNVFCTGLGTTGTALGARHFFDSQSAKVEVVGVICEHGSAVPGVRSMERLEEIGFEWRDAVTCVEAGTKISFQNSLALCRTGLLAGPSSGFALAGLHAFLRQREAHLDAMRNADGNVYAVFICADTPFPYLDKYSTHLDADEL